MIKITSNRFYSGQSSPIFTASKAREVHDFHKMILGYEPTPLIELKSLAQHLGVKSILVKDESKRFGLNAFKVLGGSYALGMLLATRLNVSLSEVNLKTIATRLPEPLTFATATAGNHGTGIAWAAREMGQKAVVYMPSGAARSSVERIKNLAAECIVTDVNYDDTVRLASRTAEENGWTLVQDTAWEGYEQIPTWISQGYMTMAAEAHEQINSTGQSPTHIFLQAGVGAMAGGVLGYYRDALGSSAFESIICEPMAADCLHRSASSETGERVNVNGALDSIMTGLACGEVNPVTWNLLRDCGRFFASVSDEISATGMRVAGNPLQNDDRIISGESGAIGLGLLYQIMSRNESGLSEIRNQLNLNSNSVVLIFSTEGDTNPQRYRDIVWHGKYSTLK
ncbi:diaminopropionate ammonia-lyase [Pantoea vagans]|uniref:diaminopropionate ammonia-lyase n=1 Tax=Pantoea vagans TaxID=470934 RepID=UPI00225614FF|nr:diaminopropionate ammonia-lyase [Pantoea vagans]MCX3310981.1 diaminopropionate ammonia-lyase [Pantoea vagans]